MMIDVFRKIDRWAGLPFCYILSGFHWLRSLAVPGSRRAHSSASPSKILFIKLSEMGAMILAYPLMKEMKTAYPGAQLFFLTNEKNKEVFPLFSDVISPERIITVNMESIGPFLKDVIRMFKRLFHERVDIVFDLELFSRFTAILSYLCLAPKRIGFHAYHFEGLYRGNWLTHRVQYNPLIHISRNYLALGLDAADEKKRSPEFFQTVRSDNLVLPSYVPDPCSLDEMRQRISAMGVPPGSCLLLLNPGEGALPLREWPLENYARLVRRLLEDTCIRILLVGAKGMEKKAQELAILDPARCHDLCGKTTIRELMALFHLADGLIANDCGLVHLASVCPIKKFIFFGPESPVVFAPLDDLNWFFYAQWPCSPCLSAFNHRNSTCRDNQCLKAISVDQVYETITKNL